MRRVHDHLAKEPPPGLTRHAWRIVTTMRRLDTAYCQAVRRYRARRFPGTYPRIEQTRTPGARAANCYHRRYNRHGPAQSRNLWSTSGGLCSRRTAAAFGANTWARWTMPSHIGGNDRRDHSVPCDLWFGGSPKALECRRAAQDHGSNKDAARCHRNAGSSPPKPAQAQYCGLLGPSRAKSQTA